MRRLLLILLVLVFMPINSYSATFTDIDPDDGMNKGVTIYDPTDPDYIVNFVEVFIGENHLVPYDSPGGRYGIVNQAGGFFDMWVSPMTPDEIDAETVQFSFGVNNNSGIHWSDYHFEFYTMEGDVDITQFINIKNVLSDSSFDQHNFAIVNNYWIIDFWSETRGVAPGGSAGFTIELGLSNMTSNDGFLLRQIATTAVPIPSAFVLLASSLVCFAGLRRKLNR